MAQELLTLSVEITTNLLKRGDIVVRRAAARESAHVLRRLRLASLHAYMHVAIVGRGNVHELPGNVRTSGAGSPAEDLRQIFVLGQRIDERLRLLAVVLEDFDQDGK